MLVHDQGSGVTDDLQLDYLRPPMSLALERSLFQEAYHLLKEKGALAEKQREEEKKREEARKQEEDTRKKTEETREFTIKRLTKDMKDKDKEIERLRAAEQDKNQKLIKMQNNQEAKEKELKQEARRKRDAELKAKTLEAKCKEMEGKLEAELKAKDQRIATLEAKCKEMEGKPAAAQDVRLKPDDKQNPCKPETTANRHSVTKLSVQTGDAAAEPKGAATRPSSSPRTLPHLVFGTCYQFGRGSPQKAQQRAGCVELPYDDAFGATRQCLVLCDGVGGGGAASGRWARLCVKECLAQAEDVSGHIGIEQLQRPGDATKNAAGEIVSGAMKRLTTVPGFEDSHATTTLLVVHLVAGINGKGEAMLKIDACEIGDSRWALLCWNATGRRYVCTYLAEA